MAAPTVEPATPLTIGGEFVLYRLDLQRLGGACALLYAVGLSVASFGVASAIGPDFVSANEASEFLPILAEHQALGLAFAIMLIVLPMFVAVAGMGIYLMLRDSGSMTWLALFGFVGGGLAILYRGFTWLAITANLAPAYVEADQQARIGLATLGDTLATFAIGADVVGGVLVGGVGGLLFSIALLERKAGPRWLGWLGVFGAIVGGWFSVLIPVSDTAEAISMVGGMGFVIWMAAMGIVVWRSSQAQNTTPGRHIPAAGSRTT